MSYSKKTGYSYQRSGAVGGQGKKKQKGYKYSGAKPQKRRGYSDTARYEDGGVVGNMADQARLNALKALEIDMAQVGGETLFQRFEEGGLVRSQDEYESEETENEEDGSYGDLSRSELIELLRSRR